MSSGSDEPERSEEPLRERWEVFEQPDGRWRWRWLPSAEQSEETAPIVSGETFESTEEAEESAHMAFPDLPGSVDRPRSPVAAAREAVSTGAAWVGRGVVVVGLVAAGYVAGRRARRPEGVRRTT
jgi:hypothetical protein